MKKLKIQCFFRPSKEGELKLIWLKVKEKDDVEALEIPVIVILIMILKEPQEIGDQVLGK